MRNPFDRSLDLPWQVETCSLPPEPGEIPRVIEVNARTPEEAAEQGRYPCACIVIVRDAVQEYEFTFQEREVQR